MQSEDSNIRSSIQGNQNDGNKSAHLLVLPYASLKGEKLIKTIKNYLKCMLPETVTTRVTFSEARLSSKFNCKRA